MIFDHASFSRRRISNKRKEKALRDQQSIQDDYFCVIDDLV